MTRLKAASALVLTAPALTGLVSALAILFYAIAFAGNVETHRLRITAGGSLCATALLPGGEEVIGVAFVGRYGNVGSGSDAGQAEFSLFGPGAVWTIRGSELGWTGQGVFGPSYRGSTRFDGPLPAGPVYWEVCSAAFTSPSGFVDSEFQITVRHGGFDPPESPEHPPA